MTPRMSKGHTPGQRAAPKKNTPTPNYANESGEGKSTSAKAFAVERVEFLDPTIVLTVIGLAEHGQIALHVRKKDDGTPVFSKALSLDEANRLSLHLVAAVAFVQKNAEKVARR